MSTSRSPSPKYSAPSLLTSQGVVPVKAKAKAANLPQRQAAIDENPGEQEKNVGISPPVPQTPLGLSASEHMLVSMWKCAQGASEKRRLIMWECAVGTPVGVQLSARSVTVLSEVTVSKFRDAFVIMGSTGHHMGGDA